MALLADNTTGDLPQSPCFGGGPSSNTKKQVVYAANKADADAKDDTTKNICNDMASMAIAGASDAAAAKENTRPNNNGIMSVGKKSSKWRKKVKQPATANDPTTIATTTTATSNNDNQHQSKMSTTNHPPTPTPISKKITKQGKTKKFTNLNHSNKNKNSKAVIVEISSSHQKQKKTKKKNIPERQILPPSMPRDIHGHGIVEGDMKDEARNGTSITTMPSSPISGTGSGNHHPRIKKSRPRNTRKNKYPSRSRPKAKKSTNNYNSSSPTSNANNEAVELVPSIATEYGYINNGVDVEYSTNAEGASVLAMLGQYNPYAPVASADGIGIGSYMMNCNNGSSSSAPTVTANSKSYGQYVDTTPILPRNDDHGTTLSSSSAVDNESTTIPTTMMYLEQDQGGGGGYNTAVYHHPTHGTQYPTYVSTTDSQGNPILVPTGYAVPVMVNGAVYYNQYCPTTGVAVGGSSSSSVNYDDQAATVAANTGVMEYSAHGYDDDAYYHHESSDNADHHHHQHQYTTPTKTLLNIDAPAFSPKEKYE